MPDRDEGGGPRASGVGGQHGPGLGGHGLPRGQAGGRVEVALHRHALAQPGPSGVQRHPPIDPHHIRARCHVLQQFAGAHTEVDGGYAQLGNRRQHPAARRRGEAPVVIRRQASRPAVEQLHGGGTRGHLLAQRGDRHVRQALGEVHPQRGVAEHQRLGARVVPAGAALDHVAGERERRPGEADQRHLQLADEQPHGLVDVRQILAVG